MKDYIVGFIKLADVLEANNTTVYSSSMSFGKSTGYTGALITVVSAGAASFTITQQCSLDDKNWYDPVNQANSALGQVAATFTAGTRYIQFDPVLAPFIRFKCVEGASVAGTITIRLIHQE